MANKKVKKIQDYDRAYCLLHHYVGAIINLAYSRFVQIGRENIPQDGAIIFAPNHTNTLMDALVVLNMDRNPKVFVARADVFKNRKLAKALTFLKMMPIMRQRDGFNAVKKNQEIIDKSVDVLKDKMPFCIFPEGRHQAKFSLLPLSKGIYRIAFQAQEQMEQVPLYIVPVGLKYGNFFEYRSTVRMEFGKPINVSKYIAENSELTQQEQMTQMNDLLTERLKEVILHIPNDEDYDATFEICLAAESVEAEKLLKSNASENVVDARFQANRQAAKRMKELKESNPEKAKELLELGREAHRLREKKGICIESASVKKPIVSRIGRILLTLITLPYTIPAAVLASPLVFICQFIFTKLKDPAFKNSVRFVMNLFVWPLLVLIYAIVAFCLLPWQWAIVAAILLMPAPCAAYELWKTIRFVVSDIKLLQEKKLMALYSRIRGFFS